MATSPRGHGRSLAVGAPTTSLRRDESDQPDKQHPSGSDPRFGKGDGSRVGNAPPAIVALLLLLAGDVEPNPGPILCARGQNFRQSGTPLASMRNSYLQVVCPAHNSFYRGIAQPTAGPGHQLPSKPFTPAADVIVSVRMSCPGLHEQRLRSAIRTCESAIGPIDKTPKVLLLLFRHSAMSLNAPDERLATSP